MGIDVLVIGMVPWDPFFVYIYVHGLTLLTF